MPKEAGVTIGVESFLLALEYTFGVTFGVETLLLAFLSALKFTFGVEPKFQCRKLALKTLWVPPSPPSSA